jgi:hypothetical protein
LVRHRFVEDFGVEPFIVTASEEEAPRVLQNEFVARIAQMLTFDNWRDQLAELLADEHLFAASKHNNTIYATHLIEALLGQADGEPWCQPSVDFVRTSGKIVRTRTGERAFYELRARVIAEIAQRGRKAAVLSLLGSDLYICSHIRELMRRYLRKPEREWSSSDVELAGQLRGMLRNGEPYADCLLQIFLTRSFAAAAGGDDRVIDLIYQTLVWRCPNPEYVNNHSTIDDAGKRAFEEIDRIQSRGAALKWFLQRYEVAEAVVSDWLFKYYFWYNPGPANSCFYWGGAIAPVIRDVAAVGPGYDQSGLRTRPTMVQPRHNGQRYAEQLSWIRAMSPQPWMLHLETWNEFFEGTCICDCDGFRRQYIDITASFAQSIVGFGDGANLSKPIA